MNPFKKIVFSFLFILLVFPKMIHGENEEFERFTAIPFAAYSEETKIQYGGLLIFFFKPLEGSQKTSAMDIIAVGTTRNQYRFTLRPNFWFFEDKLHIPANFSFYKWHSSLFERGSRGSFERILDYKNNFFSFKIPLEMSFGIPQDLPFRYGFIGEGEYRENKIQSTDKSLKDGYFLGGGYTFIFDNRDNENWPTKGTYCAFEEMFFGGDYKFHTENIDGRYYWTPNWEITLALGFDFKQSRGNVPISRLSGPDGTKRFRGVESPVWNDTQAMIFQGELRKPLFWRIGGTLFGETLQTAPYFSELFKRKFHYAVGGGIRVILNKREKICGRADLSLIDLKHIGLSVDMREAF